MILELSSRTISRLALEWRSLFNDRSGATAIEYGLIIALIAIGLISTVGGLGDLVNQMYGMISGRTNEVVAAMPNN
ncbi:Flp family type IVb pilin [Kordiimonas marina]|uniref:Flp family type IVb pilin n=1 Tax=Kordiimonas marina TaxID=2872312 RepID=UPI001FF178E2|nr:Flp family type IVb pilin [Kordiimonas marina]MCJ9430462.1 Flp family type IVb pilin [Kordiimonas marina]